MKLWISLVVFIMVSLRLVGAQQEEIAYINRGDQSIDVQNEIYYYLDHSRSLDFKDPDLMELWKPNKGGVPSFGYTNADVWIKVNVHNRDEINRWVLQVANPLLDSLTIYFKNDSGAWENYTAGDLFPFSKRLIAYRHMSIPVQLPQGKTTTFYLKAEGSSSMFFPITFHRLTHFYNTTLDTEVVYGMFYGIMCVMILYNIFIFMGLRSATYVYYVLTILANLLIYMVFNGHAAHYLWPEAPVWNNLASPMLVGIGMTFTSLFASSFLEAKKNIPRIAQVFRAIAVFGALFPFGVFFVDFDVMVSLSQMMSLVLLTLSLVAGIVCVGRGIKTARFYLLAWTFYLIGAMIFIFRNFNWLNFSFITSHAIEIGSALEVVLLSIALTDKYRQVNQERKVAQEKLIKFQRETNITLEKKVGERTEELQEANSQVKQQNHELKQLAEEIATQRDELEARNELIERKNENIVASITYAQRIQSAMLPTSDKLSKAFDDHFIFFRPRDIVSGDFYWFQEHRGHYLVAALDCTGHGVPGAFMSLIGNEILNEIVLKRNVLEPNKILDELHEGVKSAFQQRDVPRPDGMDVALCVYNPKKKQLQFAGAKCPLMYVIDGEVHLIRGDKMPIGEERRGKREPYTAYTIDIKEPMQFYVYTDGFQDQFGGTRGEKFMNNNFRDLLLEISPLPYETQPQVLEERLNKWIKGYPQVDDMLVIGFALS